jgi:predicted lactoylglutathione lyase
MATKIFVNLPVKDLNKSVTFFKSIGYTFNQQFTDETATCMIISEDIYVMLLTHPKFKEFTPNAICDAKQSTEVITCLSCENKDQVAAIVKKALAAGAKRYAEPKDHGFMVQDGFQDPDGHIWEYMYMDPSFVQPQ